MTQSSLSLYRPLSPTPTAGSEPALARYLRQLREVEPLTEEAEAELYRRYQAGDRDAGERLVVANLMTVVRVARRYTARYGELLDLIQEGNVGVLRALEKYDPTRDIAFSAYARYWIRAMILQFVMENHRMVQVAGTRNGRRVFYQLARERADLRQSGEEATPAKLAERLGMDEQELNRLLGVMAPETSLDAPSAGLPLADRLHADIEPPDETVHRQDLVQAVRQAMETFSETLTCEREQALLGERLVADEPISLADLGRRFGVTRERMRQIERKLKGRIRAFLLDELGAELEFAVAA